MVIAQLSQDLIGILNTPNCIKIQYELVLARGVVILTTQELLLT